MLYKISYENDSHFFRPVYLESSMPEEELEGIVCALQYFYEELHGLEPLSDSKHLLSRNCLLSILSEIYEARDVTDKYDSLAAGANTAAHSLVCIDWYESIDFWGWSSSSRYECIKRYLPKERMARQKVRDMLYKEPL